MSVASTRTTALSAVIVDDTPDLRLLLRITLEQDGDFEVVAEAENGLEGVRLAGELQPDLVLLDLAMPVMDGLEALPQIRQVCPGARVVVLSGFEADTMAQRALSAGADGYLQKGTSPRRILAFVRRLVTGLDDPALESVSAPGSPSTPHATTTFTLAEQPGAPAADQVLDEAGTVASLAGVGLLLVHAGSGSGDNAVLGYANLAATTMLGLQDGATGSMLAAVAPQVQALLVRRMPDLRAGREPRDRTTGHGRSLEVVMRRGERDQVVVTVMPATRSDEANVLRQAISTTAHEIRNPVTLLSGVATVVKNNREDLPPEHLDRLLGAVGRQTLILERLTDDLLTAAQAGRGSLRVDVRAVDLEPVLRDVVADVREFSDVALDGADGVQVLADRDRLSQMLANLMGNAVKYGAAPYGLSIRSDDAGLVHIDVLDSGAGVDEGFRSQLFDEFTRADDAQARGTGLGLFVVRSLAEAQGGRATYRPRDGGGSVFTITLARAKS